MTLQVLVEKTEQGQYRAVTSQPFALAVEADSAGNAVRRLKETVEKRLSECEVVEFDVAPPRVSNPWQKYAGVWKLHPEFDVFQEAVTEYRAGADASRE